MSLYSLNTLFTETNSPWLIYESIKNLEIKTSIIFNLAVPSNTILSCFLFFFFIIDLYFLIPKVIAQIFNGTAELVMQTETQINEGNEEIETQTVIFEAKISKCST